MNTDGKLISFLDWDGTLRKGYTLFDWTAHLNNLGLISGQAIEDLNKTLSDYKKGGIVYSDLVENTALIYANSVRGISKHELQLLAKEFVKKDKDRLFSFSKSLIKYLHEKKIRIVAVSGAPSIVLKEFAKALKINDSYGLDLEVDSNGRYTGDVKSNHGTYNKKKAVVSNLTRNGETIILGIGNAKSDLPLLENAKHSFILEQIEDHFSSDIILLSPSGALKDIKNRLEGKKNG